MNLFTLCALIYGIYCSLSATSPYVKWKLSPSGGFGKRLYYSGVGFILVSRETETEINVISRD